MTESTVEMIVHKMGETMFKARRFPSAETSLRSLGGALKRVVRRRDELKTRQKTMRGRKGCIVRFWWRFGVVVGGC